MSSTTFLPIMSSSVFRKTYSPITRHRLALYCGGSGDQNPIHVDSDFAKASGYDDVFVHGMLVMAYLGRALTDVLRPNALRAYGVRFVAKTQIHATITCEGSVEEANADEIRLKLVAKDEFGDVKVTGSATVSADGLLGGRSLGVGNPLQISGQRRLAPPAA